MTTNTIPDAVLTYKGLSLISKNSNAYQTGWCGGASHSAMQASSSVATKTDDNDLSHSVVTVNIEKSPEGDPADLVAAYKYEQNVGKEELLLEVDFGETFPAGSQFQVESSNFSGFNLSKRPIKEAQVGAKANDSFNTDLTLSLWFGEPADTTPLSVTLKFYKIEESGGIGKQVLIAKSEINLDS